MKKISVSFTNAMRYFLSYKRRYFNFIIPNLSFIFSKRVSFQSQPTCIQKVFFTGEGKVFLGHCCSFGYKLGGHYRKGYIELQPRYKESKIKIGSNISCNNNLFVCAANYVEIGDYTLIGQYVTMIDHEAHGLDPAKRRELGEIGKVIIGKNVWIGNNVTILKNSEIGDNSIIAAGAVVSGKFPEDVIIGGIPARIIKKINE